jgi:hypothetical protein
MKYLLTVVLLCSTTLLNAQSDHCDKAFTGVISLAWGTNNKHLGGVQAEGGVWGNKIPLSFYVGIMAWTCGNLPAADKEAVQDQTRFCDLYFKLGIITYKGGENGKIKNELTCSLPISKLPEFGYGIYYEISPGALIGIEPVYQMQTSTYGGFVRIKLSL